MKSAGVVVETQEMRQEEPGHGDPIEPLDGHKINPFGPDRSSDRLGWGSVEAARYRVAPASECSTPALTHHRLVLFARPSEELELLYEGVNFARQFKRTTGVSPHQYVIARRVERAKLLLQRDSDLSLAEIAAHAGFSDQSQFCYHFKRLVGVMPGQFRMPAKIA